jgi:hypothetical protein
MDKSTFEKASALREQIGVKENVFDELTMLANNMKAYGGNGVSVRVEFYSEFGRRRDIQIPIFCNDVTEKLFVDFVNTVRSTVGKSIEEENEKFLSL